MPTKKTSQSKRSVTPKKRVSASKRTTTSSKKVRTSLSQQSTPLKAVLNEKVFEPGLVHISLAIAILSLLFTSLVALNFLTYTKEEYTKVIVQPVKQNSTGTEKQGMETSPTKELELSDLQLEAQAFFAEIEDYVGERIELTQENVFDVVNGNPVIACGARFNLDEADKIIEYRSVENGLKIDVPYNENWGNNKYFVAPYWEGAFKNQEGISFGLVHNKIEGCGWVRDVQLKFAKAQSADQVIEGIVGTRNTDIFAVEPTVVKVGNLNAVYYSYEGMCSGPTLVIIGKKYNYELYSACNSQTLDQLLEIAKTIQLL